MAERTGFEPVNPGLRYTKREGILKSFRLVPSSVLSVGIPRPRVSEQPALATCLVSTSPNPNRQLEISPVDRAGNGQDYDPGYPSVDRRTFSESSVDGFPYSWHDSLRRTSRQANSEEKERKPDSRTSRQPYYAEREKKRRIACHILNYLVEG